MSRDCEEGASDARPRLLVDVEAERASLVKRSDMALSWSRDGSMMCTSGWGHWGSCILATISGARTTTGMSCVMVVSRSCGKKAGLGSPKESLSVGASSTAKGALSGSRVVVVIDVGGRVAVKFLVIMVRERRGTLSFLVKRMEAEEAESAERRARWRGARGMRRLMVLFSTADWMVYVSKMVS